ncbi:MAG: RNase adapter RapZ [Meiothermus sp.]|uniref:RNase adapter RapZ n=1 Tax=Meiothermus sp. TaxID=1955249 RepID=UPI0025DA5502|nr:RNase adapter RapZ [Meiothermus sp.]MCS7057286.1 RNase adapter RapZ [Meiothermus sp.]MCS7193655.1 RNase adapter RapZ [Meiothermus sp.]MCX7739819.1 RNase adapter RapZ [Meiothermus sp.]MDW8091454.1 RNase adapter RapZ [Meiothermus sp.]MDW8481922.1 RNase adapter RapZ [Meiothermus sp.]
MRFVVLSGQSGAGLTSARMALEDLGYFSVDNLPPQLWGELLKTVEARGIHRVVTVLDIRARGFLLGVEGTLQELKPFIVYLEARSDVLLRRYNLSRRLHPLGMGNLLREIEEERRALLPLRDRADLVLDTSERTPRQLKEALEAALGEEEGFLLRMLSFGFKWGPPQDADLVLDVRSLPNPHYDPVLKSRPGTDPEVAAYVFSDKRNETFYRTLLTTIGLSAEGARQGGRAAYTVAVGCTGGQHRSVAVAERLAQELSGRFRVELEHRDLEKALAG